MVLGFRVWAPHPPSVKYSQYIGICPIVGVFDIRGGVRGLIIGEGDY